MVPKPVREATQEYRKDEDTFGRFLDECCVREDGCRTGTSVLHARYKRWADLQGITRPLSLQGFGRQLNDRGFKDLKDSSGRIAKIGLRLVPEEITEDLRRTASSMTEMVERR